MHNRSAHLPPVEEPPPDHDPPPQSPPDNEPPDPPVQEPPVDPSDWSVARHRVRIQQIKTDLSP